MRILIPILAIVVGIVFAIAVGLSNRPDPKVPTPPPAASSPVVREIAEGLAGDVPVADAPVSDTPAPEAASETDPTASPEKAIAGLRVVNAPRALAPILGSDEPESDFKLQVRFTAYGAGIRRIATADFKRFVSHDPNAPEDDPYELVNVTKDLPDGEAPVFYPYAARWIEINGERLDVEKAVWQAEPKTTAGTVESVTYRLPLVDAQGDPVADIVRTWSLAAGSYDIQLSQTIVNRSIAPLQVAFAQYGQGDVLLEEGNYLGDRRMFITGHFRPEKPAKFGVYVDDSYFNRRDLVSGKYELWPNASLKPGARLAWIAAENRYFALITHAPIPDTVTATAGVPELDGIFPGIGTEDFTQRATDNNTGRDRVAVELTSSATDLAPGASRNLSLALFAGPRQKDLFAQRPFELLQFNKLIRYELSCSFCTWQWLAKGLLGFMTFIHWGLGDWGVAIILLVLTVRLILHPITKRAQTNMLKMSKQMGKMQPEMAKLKEKYKNDPTAMNRETMKLYKEAGVSPANVLGCLPMLLQTPIWIALYAMLYFAIELRHEPAFYGIFQTISGGRWHFLEDLSVADNFIRFIPPEDPAYKLSWMPIIKPEFRSINILPLAMAFVFFFQMKLTTPPPTNEQQAQQQKIMRIMPFIFPVMLYSAPSGLTLYITCSTLAGIVDSWIVRKHVREQEEAGTLFDKKPVKPGGWREKIAKRVALAQEMAAAQQAAKQAGKSPGRKSVDSKSYKKRK